MRSVVFSALLLAAPLVTGCVSKAQFDDLEKRVAAVEAAQKEGGAKSPGATQQSPEEQAAMQLMKDMQKAAQAGDYATAKAKLAELQSDAYKNTRSGKASTRMGAEINLVGTDAKALEVEKWYQGKTDLNDGKATLVVFWESWCPHCKDEMPKMEPIYEEYKAKGLNVVGLTKVTKSASDDTVKTFISEHKITFPIAKEANGSMSSAYAVSGIPAAAIVKDGKVIWRGHPGRLTPEMLNGFLGS
jgi:thiol-disulfide isomerase/thioredoxin